MTDRPKLYVAFHAQEPDDDAEPPSSGYARASGAPKRWNAQRIRRPYVMRNGEPVFLTDEEADAIDPNWRGPN